MEIPEDLAQQGLMLWIDALRDGTPDAGNIIARALLAERERCAKIAERATVDVKARGVDGVRAAPIPHRSEIAAAIRTPSTGEET